MQLRPALLALGFAGLLGCAKAPAPAPSASPEPEAAAVPQHAAATEVKPLEKKKFGGAVTETRRTSLDELMKTPEKFADKTVRTEGRVFAVCEHKGCWMEIADESGKAHIKMAGHAFFVPREVKGHRAAIQGKVFAPKKDHCTEEAEAQTGGVAQVQIEANAIEILD